MKAIVAASAGAALSIAAPAAAAARPDLDGEIVLADFARCAVKASPITAAAIVDTAPGSAEEEAGIEALFRRKPDCMKFPRTIGEEQVAADVNLGNLSVMQAQRMMANQRRHMVASNQAIRGAVATALFLRADPKVTAGAATGDSEATASPPGYAVVRCAAAQDPAAAAQLVRSKRLSADEAAATRTLAPLLNACARGRGRIDMSGTAIHGWAAEALFKQARGSSAVAQ